MFVLVGWGLALAFTSVVVAPRLQRRFGTVTTLLVNLSAIALVLAVMAAFTESKAVLAISVVVAGLFFGINNTLITETVMKAAPVERGVASAAYSFVRFSGGAIAPWLAGVLGERVSVHLPFWVGAAAVACADLGLRATIYLEVFGADPAPALEHFAATRERVQGSFSDRVRPGISPHAPYSVSLDLYRAAAELGLPIATHISESPAEVNYVRAFNDVYWSQPVGNAGGRQACGVIGVAKP